MERESIALWLKLAAGALAAAWGGLPVLIQVLISLMALDILTGLLAGYVTRSLSSDVSWRGVGKKGLVLLVVASGAVLEQPTGLPVGQAIAGFYAAHEGLSIVENAARAGLPVPQVLRDALQKLSPDVREARDG